MLQHLFGKPSMPEETLPGRDEPIITGATHHVNGRSIMPPYPTASRSRTSAWAASGARRRSSGRSRACG